MVVAAAPAVEFIPPRNVDSVRSPIGTVERLIGHALPFAFSRSHRTLTARRADSLRSAFVRFRARFRPPLEPSSTAAGFFSRLRLRFVIHR